MKKHIIALAIIALAIPLMAQDKSSNNTREPKPPAADNKNAEAARLESGPDQGRRFNQRNVRLFEWTLNKIGITEEQFGEVAKLQVSYMQKMNENATRLNIARNKFQKLLEEGATEGELEKGGELEKVICEIAEAQAEQLRILAQNRRAVEKILGREKYDRFMEEAVTLFQQHNQGGMGMPFRPDMPLPSLPNDEPRNREGRSQQPSGMGMPFRPDMPAPPSNEPRNREGWPR
ncbi:MAG: hypothetical protein GXY61_07710 [Lentisphaerae bacterium]|jgi:ribosomal protein L17|nr:hypothetical protein [Lentisphaerota bacterium]